MNKDGSKLSKRSGGHVNAQDYLAEGYEPEALLNFVALMGCNWHGREGDNEVMSLSEMVDGVRFAAFLDGRGLLTVRFSTVLYCQRLSCTCKAASGQAPLSQSPAHGPEARERR